MFTGKLGDYAIICYNTYGNIFCPTPAEMNYKELADRTSFFKEQEKGVSSVCEIMEELMARGRQEGRKKVSPRGARRNVDTISYACCPKENQQQRSLICWIFPYTRLSHWHEENLHDTKNES